MKTFYLFLLPVLLAGTTATAQWSKVTTSSAEMGIPKVFHDGTTSWAGGTGTTFKSTNNGESWTEVSSGLNSSISGNTGFAKVGNRTYTTFGGNGNYYAYYTENGTSWTIDTSNWAYRDLPFVGRLFLYSRQTFSHKNEYVMCVLESNFIIYKKNSDAAWTHMDLPQTHRTPDAVYSSGDTLFLFMVDGSRTSTNVAYTTDLGANWNTRSVNGPIAQIYKNNSTATLYAAGATSFQNFQSEVILRSTDNGITWDSLNNRAFSDGNVTDIVADGDNLYVAIAGNNNDTLRKVIQSKDNGQTWTDITGNIYSLITWKFHPLNDLELINGNLFAGVALSSGLLKYSGTTSGINSIRKLTQTSVFPNPVNTTLHVDVNGPATIRFFDISGKLHATFNAVDGELNVSELKSGLYFIEIGTAKGTSYSKVVKQ